MEKLLLSSFIIFLSMNILAHESEISRINEIEELVSKFDQKPAAFINSSQTCDAEFISFWLSSSEMFWKSEFNDIVYPHICEELKRDPDINLAFIKKSPSIILENIDPKLVSNYDELAKTAVSSSGWKLRHVKSEALSNAKLYDKLAETAVSKVAEVFEYVKPEFLSSPKVYDNLATAYVMLVVANYLKESKYSYYKSKEYKLKYLSGL